MDIKQIDNTYVAETYARFPLEIAKGEGCIAYDENGKSYIDLGSGIAANAFGYADKVWADAVSRQANSVQHTSNLYYCAPGAKLAQLLCEKTGMKKVFFANSGAEANECAIKTARRWAFKKYGDESHAGIITLVNSFHGRTITTLAATGQDTFHTEFGPFTPGFYYAPADDASAVRKLAEENGCCAVMMELVQGEGGVNALSKEFVADVLEIAKEHDLLIIIDEIQTGNGRTGKLYAWMHYGFTPDIMSTAKGLGGGLPIGACLMGEKVENVMTPGSHGSTFGGNPVCCAGALSIIERLDDALMDEVCKKSEYIINELTGAKGVNSVTGMGLMLGIDTVRPAKEVLMGCMERGVLVLTAKTKVRLLPPLNIPFESLKKAISILKEELAK
ncbi:MAG: acetylornithine/succinylornithine family transaminase [Oscillospiraceae bacterium]|nr:acetylornithine/succinylornithine family transaminase [Oscillospiraceae bacterium]